MKKVWVIRHASATGQEEKAALTPAGKEQALLLATALAKRGIRPERIVSSPFLRAQETIEPFATNSGIPVETDPRLKERVLTSGPLPEDWRELVRASFENLDMPLVDGESGREAMERGREVFNEIVASVEREAVLVTHGNLAVLLLRSFDSTVGDEQYGRLTTPDVFEIRIETDKTSIHHLKV